MAETTASPSLAESSLDAILEDFDELTDDVDVAVMMNCHHPMII